MEKRVLLPITPIIISICLIWKGFYCWHNDLFNQIIFYHSINISNITGMPSGTFASNYNSPSITIIKISECLISTYSWLFTFNTNSIIIFNNFFELSKPCFYFITINYSFHNLILSFHNFKKVSGPQSIGLHLYPVIIFLSNIKLIST